MNTKSKTRRESGLALPAELELIGILLNRPAALPEVGFLTRDDFMEERHYDAYQAIKRLHESGETVSLLTVCQATVGTEEHYSYLALVAKDYGFYSTPLRNRAVVMRKYATDRACTAAAQSGDWPRIVQLRQELARLDHHLPQTLTAGELLAMQFSPQRWLVEGVLPEGVSLLVSPPKVGKTRLATQLAIAVASGGYALNHPDTTCQPAEVLYLVLESGNRRAQKDLQQLGGTDPRIADRLHIAADWRRLSAGGAADLEHWLDAHPNVKLVIIDTLAAVRNSGHGGSGFLYSEDYLVGGTIKRIADQRGVSVVLIHHSRKGDAEDVLDNVSGSSGVTGSVDHILVIKRKRLDQDGTLTLISRDYEDRELALRYQSGLWTLLGTANEVADQDSSWRGDGQSDERREILSLLREEPMTPAELAEVLEKNQVTTRRLLMKMVEAGKVGKRFDGKYTVITEPVQDDVHVATVHGVHTVHASSAVSDLAGKQDSYPLHSSSNQLDNSTLEPPKNSVNAVNAVNAVNNTDADTLIHGLLNGCKGLNGLEVRTRLGWNEDRFNAAKNSAFSDGRIFWADTGGWYAKEVKP